ncbi:hypothetical protein QJS10_CPB14g01755 [Acorus calamus]|uniref:Uncharacterized protein n=1 Tax=Acorus calamus TaxID=4465 RepID=A0AAV9DCT2_ACOCL|nr:hypothetical protein QJS10_CPB14g01755 [Acorus calamus]
MEPAIFSPSSLFRNGDDDSSDEEETDIQQQQTYVERRHVFPGMELLIREFSFHQLNANLLWPGTFSFCDWLVEHKACLEGRKIIELGSGTGALGIFLRKSFGLDITTSDFDDLEIEENIAHNCRANGVTVLPHIKHTWGDAFPTCDPEWDIVIASDILLYVKQYPKLIKTLSFLLKSYKPKHKDTSPRSLCFKKIVGVPGKDVQLRWPVFLMSWRRRIGKEDEALFFNGCEDAGLVVEHIGSRVFSISPGRLQQDLDGDLD